MRQGWEIEGRSSSGRSVAVHQPYLLDVDKMTDRLTRFQSAYSEKVSLIDGQCWRNRRTGNSARPLVMLPGIQGGGSVILDVAPALGEKLDLIMVTPPPIIDAAALADVLAEFLLALGIRKIDLFGSSLGRYLAQVFGIRHPHMVGHMFLANTFADPRPFLAKAPSADAVAAQPAELTWPSSRAGEVLVVPARQGRQSPGLDGR